MIKDGIEYKKCDKCGKLCAKLEMVNWKTCKECVISELEKEKTELKEKLSNYQKGMFDEIEKRDIKLTNAKILILRLYNAGRDVLMCRAEEKAYDNLSNAINDKSIAQFLEEIEK